MQPLRRHINPKTFVITLRQIAKYLKISPTRILNWEKWHHVLWVHIEGKGGYFVSYRKLQQWIAACRQLSELEEVWFAILQEAVRYTEEALIQLEVIPKKRLFN